MTQQRTFPENVSHTTALDEIRARLEAATPGPWESDGVDIAQAGPNWGSVVENTVSCISYCYGGSIRQDAKPADLRFITHAPTDVARLLAAVEAVENLAAGWTARGEHDMEFSKTLPDEDIATYLLTEGASMVEKARHIRNAIAAALEVR